MSMLAAVVEADIITPQAKMVVVLVDLAQLMPMLNQA
jgi:hypothetical protein